MRPATGGVLRRCSPERRRIEFHRPAQSHFFGRHLQRPLRAPAETSAFDGLSTGLRPENIGARRGRADDIIFEPLLASSRPGRFVSALLAVTPPSPRQR